MSRKAYGLIKQARQGHTAENVRMLSQERTITRTSVWVTYHKKPVVITRFMGVNRTVCRYRIISAPGRRVPIPK